jgi:hypothetical protein
MHKVVGGEREREIYKGGGEEGKHEEGKGR